MANQKFWDTVRADNPDSADFVRPAGDFGGEKAEIGSKAEEWLKGKPEFVAEAARKALLEGDAVQVADVIAEMKRSSTATASSGRTKADAGKNTQKVVDEKIKKAAETASQPKSINDLPGKSVPSSDKDAVENADDITAAVRGIHKGNMDKYDELLDELLEA
ncbi:MAG: hypothetical protein GWO26_02320 [Phycisphaerae bacterium]|nr:hypothetical protein [Phycisphaerae bacterium]